MWARAVIAILRMQYVYAVNVACVPSCVRDIRCVCKGCVLGTEVCFVDIVGKPVVYRP